MSAPSVVITGAGRGIGAETAAVLAARGWRVIVADLDAGAASLRAEALNQTHLVAGDHLSVEIDVADEASVDHAFGLIGRSTGALAGLVNGAGVIHRQPAETYDLTRWRQQLDVHLTGSMLCSQRAYPLLKRRGSAAIVNLASVGSTLGLAGRLGYATAKAGVLGMTRTLATEWGGSGVRVNAVAPGYVATEMVKSGLRAGTLSQAKLIGRTPMGRLAEPREIGTVIAFLLSEDASYINGATLRADGGLTIDGRFE